MVGVPLWRPHSRAWSFISSVIEVKHFTNIYCVSAGCYGGQTVRPTFSSDQAGTPTVPATSYLEWNFQHCAGDALHVCVAASTNRKSSGSRGGPTSNLCRSWFFWFVQRFIRQRNLKSVFLWCKSCHVCLKPFTKLQSPHTIRLMIFTFLSAFFHQGFEEDS